MRLGPNVPCGLSRNGLRLDKEACKKLLMKYNMPALCMHSIPPPTSYLQFSTSVVEATSQGFISVIAPGHVVNLCVFIRHLSIQAVGQIMQDTDTVLHRLKEKNSQITSLFICTHANISFRDH